MRLLSLTVFIVLLSAALAALADPQTKPSSSINPNLPTLFIVGDSTVHNGTKGQEGWGDPIKAMFDRTKINVENRAIGGRSSRTFRTEGRWDKTLADAKPGDFVIMQLGHNDAGPLSGDDRNRGTIRGGGEETKDVPKPDGSTETVHTYGWYMRQYAIEAKAKGMTPIICSYVPRCPRPTTQPAAKAETKTSSTEPLTSYALWAKEAADATGSQFVDLYSIIRKHWEPYTAEELKTKFFTEADFTHSSPEGAKLNAACVVEGLRQAKSPLVKYLANDAVKSASR
jgi:rhamnogalacturonan acetylesterase